VARRARLAYIGDALFRRLDMMGALEAVDGVLAEMGYEMLLPPLVHRVRQGVKAWRDGGIIRRQLIDKLF
jgi:hypothetical protein